MMNTANKIDTMAKKDGKKGSNTSKDVQISVRLPSHLVQELENEAAAWEPALGLATYVRLLLQKRHDK